MAPQEQQEANLVRRVGIIGGGQLSRMSLAPATALDIDLTVLCRDFTEPAASTWPDVMLGSPDDAQAIGEIARRCSVTTFDHELVDTTIVAALEADGRRFAPSAAVLAVAQSKVLQRDRFSALGLPVPPFAVIPVGTDLAAVGRFGNRHGWPLMVKADRGGYDGRGVWRIEGRAAALEIIEALHARDTSAVLEALMPLDLEVAILVARRWNGEIAAYSLVETIQHDGMLLALRAPAMVPAAMHDQAREFAEQIAQSLDVVGLLAVEFFVNDERLLVNEIATRPHNSGHYTIEGARTSQFEQHLRAVLDLPLGSTDLTAPHAATVNVVGNARGCPPERFLNRALEVPGAHIHLYGKASRPERKLGHVTVLGDDRDDVMSRAQMAAAILEGEQNDER